MSEEIKNAFDTLKAAMAANPEYAWGWHCNLAVPIRDATGISSAEADRASAHLMQHLFGHDITTHPHYTSGKSGAQAYAEMRIAAEREEDAEIALTSGDPA